MLNKLSVKVPSVAPAEGVSATRCNEPLLVDLVLAPAEAREALAGVLLVLEKYRQQLNTLREH